MWVLIRDASGARNLADLLPLVAAHGPEQCAFCTDDREPDLIAREGHLDQMCRDAVAAGIAPEDVLVMATLHGARAHGLRDLGAIAPGYRADLLLLDDVRDFRPAARPARTAASWRATAPPCRSPPRPSPAGRATRSTVAPLTTAALDLGEAEGRVRVIEIVPGQLTTHAREEAPARAGGRIVADPARDLAKIAVVERHHASGRVGRGLVTGFGLRHGAFASTVAHDAHNTVIVGTDDRDMLACAARLAELGGGIVVAAGGAVRGELALPVAGLLSEEPYETVVERLDALHALLREQGVTVEAPFMTLSFLALSVIPSLKLTDRGLVDVDAFALVPLAI